MSGKLNAYTLLKKAGIIEKVKDVKYLCFTEGNHYFGHKNKKIYLVDLVINTIKSNGEIIHRG
jgi:hypothetical protein